MDNCDVKGGIESARSVRLWSGAGKDVLKQTVKQASVISQLVEDLYF